MLTKNLEDEKFTDSKPFFVGIGASAGGLEAITEFKLLKSTGG